MHIDIYSDPICPWCFIGKRRLERALLGRPTLKPKIRWRAFQLNPAMPERGMERRAYLTTKFGGLAEAQRLYGQIGNVGSTEGIHFQFDRISVTPNTIDAHRLIRFAQRVDLEDTIVEGLFQSYFLDGQDIGDRAALVQIASDAGLDTDQVKQHFAGTDDLEAVRSEDMRGRQLGIEGVPCFIVNERYALSGAQEPEAFVSLFDMGTEEFRQQVSAE